MTFIVAATYGLLTLLIAPCFLLIFAVTTAAACRWFRDRPAEGSRRERFVVVIPAHDEQGSIGRTVASCLAARYDAGRFLVVVIADNCGDGTAEEARRGGAHVVERVDATRRSKGHALEYFFDHADALLPAAYRDFDAAVVVDADTAVGPDLLEAFSAALAGGGDWFQCYYTVSNPDATWRTRLLTYAFSLFNGVWPLGQDALGLGVTLRGNGMCFRRDALRRHPWRVHGLTEDMEFSWGLRVSGQRVRFVRHARVGGEMVSRGGAAAAGQRRRWEAGRKAVRRKYIGPIIRSAALGPWSKAAYALDLFFPPLSNLALALLIAATVHLWARVDGRLAAAADLLAWPHAAMAAIAAAYALSPVWIMDLPPRYLLSLARFPGYVAWKLVAAGGRAPTRWVRTRREAAAGEGPA